MPGSKYDRELRFIATETARLDMLLRQLRESMPSDPAEANAKARQVMEMEEKMGELLSRKKEIEDSFIAAGMQPPNVSNDLNSNIQNYRPFMEDSDDIGRPAVKPSGTKEELTAQVASITDEVMQIEMKMLKADMDGDDEEKQKLSMMASALRARRDSLVEEIRAINAMPEIPEEPEPAGCGALERRIESLEADSRALRAQVSDIRNDLSDIKELLRSLVPERPEERSRPPQGPPGAGRL